MKRFLILLSLAVGLSLNAAELSLDLGNYSLNKRPDDFRSTSPKGFKEGDWRILMDDVAPALPPLTPKAQSVTKQRVISQTGSTTGRKVFPLLVYREEEFTSLKLSAQIKVNGGIFNQVAGLVLRAKDENNFYSVRLNADAKKVEFVKAENGAFGEPIGVPADIKTGEWNELTVSCENTQINILLNGQQVIPTLNDTSHDSGYFGFMTLGDTAAYFTDIKTTYTRRIPLAQKIIADMQEKYPRLLGLQIYAEVPEKEGTYIVGSTDPEEFGEAGGDVEADVIGKAAMAYGGKDRKTITVVMPLRDKNGEPIAAVRFKMKKYAGQTRNAAFARAMPIISDMQARVITHSDLVER